VGVRNTKGMVISSVACVIKFPASNRTENTEYLLGCKTTGIESAKSQTKYESPLAGALLAVGGSLV